MIGVTARLFLARLSTGRRGGGHRAMQATLFRSFHSKREVLARALNVPCVQGRLHIDQLDCQSGSGRFRISS